SLTRCLGAAWPQRKTPPSRSRKAAFPLSEQHQCSAGSFLPAVTVMPVMMPMVALMVAMVIDVIHRRGAVVDRARFVIHRSWRVVGNGRRRVVDRCFLVNLH